MGRVRADDTIEVVESAPEHGRLVALFGRGGKLAAAVTWNRPQQLVRYRRMIAQAASFEAALAQPAAVA